MSRSDSRKIFEALDLIAPVETSRASIYDVSKKYTKPPFLRFRFKHREKNDKIYANLFHAINAFKGELTWTLISSSVSPNYILLPKLFESYSRDYRLFNEAYLSEILGESYYSNIDKSIRDLDPLAHFLMKNKEVIISEA